MKNEFSDMLIYVVDDKFYNVDYISILLKEEGFEKVEKFTKSKDLLNRVEEKIPDLILMDIKMPEMNGYELCKKVLEPKERQHIPVIMITAASMEKYNPLVRSFENGAVDFVSKPVNEMELIARIKSALKSERRRKKLQNALDEIKELQALLPICSYCKKVRTSEDYWESVEAYFYKHSDIRFSHGVCPSCYDKIIKPQMEKMKKKKK